MSELIEDRTTRLREYWNEAYALKYKNLVESAAEKLPESLAGTITLLIFIVGSFEFVIVQDFVSPATIAIPEQVFEISKLKPDYNQTIGGDNGILGFRHTEETKNFLSFTASFSSFSLLL